MAFDDTAPQVPAADAVTGPPVTDRGTESVWDYPRPPALQRSRERVEIVFAGVVVAVSTRAWRVLETSHPPTYYVPAQDVRRDLFERVGRTSICEWKGLAVYYDLVVGGARASHAAWSYPAPADPYRAIAGAYAFYPDKMDRCLVDGEVVRAQDGGFYGGWITDRIAGPFKGAPGTTGW